MTASSAPRMFLTLARRELRRTRKGLVAWLVPAATLTALTVSVQPQMAQQGSVFEQKMKLMPPELLVAFGMRDANLTDPVSYLATNFTFILIIGAVFAALLGATLLTHEEAYGTGDMLWSLPMKRRVAVLAKVAVGILLIVVWEVAVAAVALATFKGAGVTLSDPGRVGLLFAGGAFVHLAVLGIALVATVRTRRPRAAATTGLGVALGLYGAGVGAALAEKLAALKWLSPFRYAEPSAIARTGALPDEAWLLPVVLIATVVVAIVVYERKDLHA